jgi:hypothetical protein
MTQSLNRAPRAAVVLLGLAVCLCGTTPRALALATEHFGNDPVAPGFLNLGRDALALANLKSRVYWYEVNGNPTFFYQGNADALNEALKKFAAVGGDVREVILLPGPAQGHNLTGDKHFAYDWSVNTPAGDHRPGSVPTMTVYVTVVAPSTPPDAKQLDRWLKDLDSDSFAVRDKARQELENLGHAASPALRKALAGKPSAEVRRAIEQLLEALKGVDIRDLKVPEGVKVLEVKDLLMRYRQGLKVEDGTERGYTAGALGGLASYADVVPDLIEVLKKDKHEYARRSAAGALSRLGKAAVPALPVLKAGLNDPDVNVRNAYEYAVKHIEAAKKEEPSEEESKRQRAILEGISAFRKTLPDAQQK